LANSPILGALSRMSAETIETRRVRFRNATETRALHTKLRRNTSQISIRRRRALERNSIMDHSSPHSFRHTDGTIDMQRAIQAEHDANAAATRKIVGLGYGIFRACTGRSRALPGFPIVALAIIVGATNFLSGCSTTGPTTSTKSTLHLMNNFSVRGGFWRACLRWPSMTPAQSKQSSKVFEADSGSLVEAAIGTNPLTR
jgi:hypothetical protein